MKSTDNKGELVLLPTSKIINEIDHNIENTRKGLQERVERINEDMEYLTLKNNGLIPCGINTEEKMKEYEQTVDKQDGVERFVFKFNKLTKAKRKLFTIPEIRRKLNDEADSPFSDIGIHIRVASNLTLHPIQEIFEILDVLVEDNKIIENENIKIMYEPIMNYEKYLIKDISIEVYITNNGMYKLNRQR